MFFDRFDRSAKVVSLRSGPNLRKGATALAFAVAAAAPAFTGSSASAAAASQLSEVEQALVLLAEQAKPTDPELLSRGLEQFKQGQFEEAQIALQQVKIDGLPQADKEKLTDTLRRVEAALAERQGARAAFEKGEAALAEKNYEEAVKQYRAAADNRFADDATRTKAASQIAVAEASLKTAKPDHRATFRQAIAEYKAGNLQTAREKFVALDQAKYDPGIFENHPSTFIRRIDEAIAAQDAAKAGPAPTPAVATAIDGKQAYEEGVAAYRKGDYAAARVNFQRAQAAGYKPAATEGDPPDRYLAMIDAKGVAPAIAAGPATTGPAVAGTEAAPGPVKVLSPAEKDLQARINLEKAAQDQRAFEAKRLVEAAQNSQQANRLPEALTFYQKARELDPANPQAAEGERQMRAAVVGVADGNLMEKQTALNKVRREAIDWRFTQAITDANAAVKTGQFDQAQEALDRARVAADSAPELFNREQTAKFSSMIATAQTDLEASRERARVASDAASATQAATDAQRRALQALDEQRRTVQALIKQAQQHIHNTNYTEALKVIDQIKTIDPRNEYAIGIEPLLHDQAIIQEQKGYRVKYDRELERQLNRAEESKIPYTDLMVYPPNWPQISEKRERGLLQERPGGAEDAQVRLQLEKKLPEVKFEGVALTDVIDFLRDVTGANIFVNWRAIEAAGVEKTAPVTARLRDVKFSKALQLILADVGGGAVPLTYTIDDGVITVSTVEDLNKNTGIQVYDIRDLLVIPPDVDQPPDFGLSQRGYSGNSGGGGGGRRGGGGGGGGRYGGGGGGYGGGGGGFGGGGGGGGLFGGGGGTSGGSSQSTQERTDQLVKDITDLMKETVDRESWIDNGGRVGSLKFLSGQLIVTQTPENHRKIVSLLDKLRETRAIQVSIETRFLTVQRNFLEDIGVDVDFFFNINDPTHWSPISVNQNSSTFTQFPTTPVPGSIGSSTNPQPAMTIQGSFLDDFQVNFLVRATQASQTSTILTAPRVTVFNAQRAYIIVGNQQAYVSDLDTSTSVGVGLYEPVIDTVTSGVQLMVQPTVSADRKYVTLSLQPQLSQLVDLVSFAVGGLQTGGIVDPNNPAPANQQSFGNIQLPLMQITSVSTIVSVPDGGTLLLGGQTLAGEMEQEEGVPILSKIPFLKRLFTNRSTAKDEQILLILVKPTIIIQRELESENFPLLNTTRTK